MIGLKTISRALLVASATMAIFAPSASALSCMRADLAQTMEAAKASDDHYYILVGTFTSEPAVKPRRPLYSDRPMPQPAPQTVKSWFDGKILSNNARWDQQVSRLPVDILISCAGPWCGGAPANGQQTIAFVKANPGRALSLAASPCPDKAFRVDPAQQQVRRLRDCFDRPCKTDTPHWR